MLKVEVLSEELIRRTSNAGKPYVKQEAYVHLPGKPYPERWEVFPARDQQGNAIPYAKGTYRIKATAFRVTRGDLSVVPFDTLEPAPVAPAKTGTGA